MIHIINFIVAGVMGGAIYALVGVGLNLIFGVMRFVYVANGEMLALGAYASFVWGVLVSPDPVWSVLIALVVGLIVGVTLERSVISAIAREGRFNDQQALVLTLGLSMLLSNLILAVFGADYRRPGALASWALHIGDLTLEGQRLVALVASFLLSTLLMVFLHFTRIGLAVRATAQNPDAALASGIDVRRVMTLTFALGSALAAAAGALVAPITYAFPAMGFPFTIKALTVIIMGGLGNLWGALASGYLLGVAESLSVLWLPTGYNALVGPLLMVLVLMLRPGGIFGRRASRA